MRVLLAFSIIKNKNSSFLFRSRAKTTAHLCTMVLDGSNMMRFAKLTDKAFAPTRGSEFAAGCDLKR